MLRLKEPLRDVINGSVFNTHYMTVLVKQDAMKLNKVYTLPLSVNKKLRSRENDLLRITKLGSIMGLADIYPLWFRSKMPSKSLRCLGGD